MDKHKKKNIVIFGSGAIGCHLAYCLSHKENNIYLISRKKNYQQIKKNGLIIEIKNNSKLIKKKKLLNGKDFFIYKSLAKIKTLEIDYLFVAVKLRDFTNKVSIKLAELINRNTAIIPPCTNIPAWWSSMLLSKIGIKLKKEKYLPINQTIGMTMWLSAALSKPGHVVIRHVQRGYPLKALNRKFAQKEKYLRDLISKRCKCPKVKNIFSEIFTKSINSLAFNLIAMKYKQKNSELKKNPDAINDIIAIMREGNDICSFFNLKLEQSIEERIRQTLKSSTHTMSMLSDFLKKRKSEMPFLWKSYEELNKYTKIKMDKTEAVYKELF
jgi:hypothetical protein